jgi:hypothetical protein
MYGFCSRGEGLPTLCIAIFFGNLLSRRTALRIVFPPDMKMDLMRFC